ADAHHWDADPHTEYDVERKRLRLSSVRAASAHTEFAGEAARQAAETRARSLLEVTPQARDEFGTRAFRDKESNAVMATGAVPEDAKLSARGAAPDAVTLFQLPDGNWPSSLALGYDGVLYAALAPTGEIRLQDTRRRWEPLTLAGSYTEEGTEREFMAWRLTAAPVGGVWALDRAASKLARVEGLPLQVRPYGPYAPGTFRPCRENSNPPRVRVLEGRACPATQTPVAIACSPQGRLALLSWVRRGDSHQPGFSIVRLFNHRGLPEREIKLLEASYPYSLAWVAENRLAVLTDEARTEALVYQLDQQKPELVPVGDVYPLRHRDAGDGRGPFLNGLTLPPHYPKAQGTAALHKLSLHSYAREGKASNRTTLETGASNLTLLDSGSTQTIWHRLYLEALIPAGCGVRVFLAATDTSARPSDEDEEAWHEHAFGETQAHDGGASVPRGAWVSMPSELPFHEGLLGCEPQKNRAGLFTALVQRTRRRVRSLRGRFLHVRVELSGDGRLTPEIAALRVYASRFSYLDNYLPELYHEDLFGPDADEILPEGEPSTRADFLERFLDNFEGVLTPLEDRIAHAHLLTDPQTASDEALEWLGGWLGVAFEPAYPTERRRRLLAETPRLYRERGTLRGLQRALDIATGGAVAGGEIVVLEDFRLRRTFATILGADLADEDDPLLAGLATSGNSYVGDTLFLGAEHRKEFLALFAADLPVSHEEQEAIDAFFERLAHRVTILVHQDIEPQDLGLVSRIVAQEIPAHVVARVLKASYPFLVGLASLVGVDTYLGQRPRPLPARIGRTFIGEGDYIIRPASLDPRLGGGVPLPAESGLGPVERPVARLTSGLVVPEGVSFTLDASGSRAGRGRRLSRFIWRMNE
ncbi:MAG TPA: phage tail protein, partial [Pyrinomonadaceae bacterium]